MNGLWEWAHGLHQLSSDRNVMSIMKAPLLPLFSAVRRLPELFIRTTQRAKMNIAAGLMSDSRFSSDAASVTDFDARFQPSRPKNFAPKSFRFHRRTVNGGRRKLNLRPSKHASTLSNHKTRVCSLPYYFCSRKHGS